MDNNSNSDKIEPCIEDMIKHYEDLNKNTYNDNSAEILDKIKELEISTTSKICLNKSFKIDEIKKGIKNLKWETVVDLI